MGKENRKENENGDIEGACTEENIIICSIKQQHLSDARCTYFRECEVERRRKM